ADEVAVGVGLGPRRVLGPRAGGGLEARGDVVHLTDRPDGSVEADPYPDGPAPGGDRVGRDEREVGEAVLKDAIVRLGADGIGVSELIAPVAARDPEELLVRGDAAWGPGIAGRRRAAAL